MPWLKTALLCLDCSWINEPKLVEYRKEFQVVMTYQCKKCSSKNLFNLSIWLDKEEKEKEKECQP